MCWAQTLDLGTSVFALGEDVLDAVGVLGVHDFSPELLKLGSCCGFCKVVRQHLVSWTALDG